MRKKYRFGVLCCFLVFLVGICFVIEVEGRIYYTCGSGYQYPNCEGHGGYQCKKDNKVGEKLTDCLKYDGAIWEDKPPFCGDGWIEGIENATMESVTAIPSRMPAGRIADVPIAATMCTQGGRLRSRSRKLGYRAQRLPHKLPVPSCGTRA